MISWLHEIPVAWMALVVCAAVGLVTAGIYVTTARLGRTRRGAALKTMSPGMLPPFAILFALLVGFMAAGVWSDAGRADQAVSAEASALRSAVLLSYDLPTDVGAPMRELIRRHIEEAVHQEWPAMAKQRAHLVAIPTSLAAALGIALRFTPHGAGQVVAQREAVAALQKALDARRQRIIVSGSRINTVKWIGVLALAVLMLMAISFVHIGNPAAAAVAMGMFATAVVVVVVMLASQDRPFTGQLGLRPTVLEQVAPPR
jgi:Protein of unknown function (DUF4239)